MNWTPLNFGEYKGKTLPQVMFKDPDWFFWGFEKGAFSGSLKKEAQTIYARATSIRIPDKDGRKMLAHYIIHRPDGSFGTIALVEDLGSKFTYPSIMIVKNVIDMRFPRSLKNYDKLGYKNLIIKIKAIVFGDSNVWMTKKKCEAFFNNDDNFVW
jgi:hypothetical protein